MATTFATTVALLSVVAPQTVSHAATSCPLAGCVVTIDARDFALGTPLDKFNFIVNVDNSKLPDDPLALNTETNSPIVAEGTQDDPTTLTREDRVTLQEGRYLVSVRALDHKMWGAYFTLPDDAANDGTLTTRIDLTEQSGDHPLPLGSIRVFVFEDNAWTNGAPDTEEGGLNGFQVGLEEQTGNAVTVDYNNDPLCGGVCKTGEQDLGTGFAQVDNLGPATYFIDVHPPEGPCNSDPDSQWYQTTTIDGGLSLQAPTEEGADGTGAPGEQLWEPPNVRTAYWFGFVCSPQDFSNPGTGEISGTARNWVEWAPYTVGTFTDPVENPYVALSDATTDQTVFVGQGDGAGNFDIQGVPAGDYNLAIWDEQLSYIMRFKPVHVNAGQTVDVNEPDDNPNNEPGIGVSRWFGWLDGHVYKDVNGNGMYDPGTDTAIANTDVDQRWRDGSIKEGTVTNPNGYYEYPTAEGGALGRWFIGEQGFSRFSAYPGASVHDERDPDNLSKVIPSCVTVDPVTGDPVMPANPCIPNAQGGGLLVNQLLLEGHRATVDWGKRDYAPGTPGQIVGITYFATTRNEFDARFQAHEDYEPAIPDVTVLLETPGPNGVPNDDDDVVVNSYVTDHWQQPSFTQDPQDNGFGDPPGANSFTQSCYPIRDFAGANVDSQFSNKISKNCLEVPLTGQQTKEGAFDGGYAFADYCPNGYDLAADNGTCVGGGDPVPLVAGDYIVHAIMPKDPTDSTPCNSAGEGSTAPGQGDPFLEVTEAHGSVPGGGAGCLYHIVREEDVNVDLGNNFTPQIPPPPCNGDMHELDQSTLVARSVPYFTADQDTSPSAPLCDKHLVVLENLQNANADFFMMTNFQTDPNGENIANAVPATTDIGDVAEPGRVIGQVFNDIYFETNKQSVWYGEPRPIGGIPVGIYARVDVQQAPHDFSITGREIGRDGLDAPQVTYNGAKWRLIKTLTTSPDGSYEALLPSTETFNCPIPQGPCPGMYIAIVDDPGFIDAGQTPLENVAGNHANAGYNPNLLTANTPFEIWPGLTTQLDTPVDPISGTACEDPAGGTTPDPSDPARPDVLQVSRPYVEASDTGPARRITIQSDFIGTAGPADATGGRVLLTDDRTGRVTTLTRANGGVFSWTPGTSSTPDTIVIQVPPTGPGFTPGPKQLTIVTANANGAVSSVNGITIHVLGAATTARTDNANTFNGNFVIDTNVVAGDSGRSVTFSGTGLSGTRTISGVIPGTGFVVSGAAATATGTRNATITRSYSVNIPTGTNTANSSSVTAADLNRTVTFAPSNGGLGGARLITAVNPGVSFTFSGTPRTSGNATRTATITKVDNGVFIDSGTFVIDPAATAADIGSPVSGPGISAGTTITSAPVSFAAGSSSPAVAGFVMSTAATATSYPATVALTIGVASPAYGPSIVPVGPPTQGGHELQNAIDGAAAGSLLVLSPGTYNENVLLWKPLKIQGLGPGGIIGAHELQGRDPEDPRFDIPGSIIDGRFFQGENATTFDTSVTANGPFVLPPFVGSPDPSVVLRGADLTVVAKSGTAFDAPVISEGGDAAAFGGARIDGLGISTGHGDGAGGIQLQASINNMQITNNIVENNGGVVTGGIGVGQPYVHGSHNYDVRIANNRLIGNGGLTTSGGMGLFYGSNRYDVARNIVCSNFSVEYGAGISHIGLSPNGSIHDNRIYYNDAVDSGAGIAIETELVVGDPTSLGDGSGSVNVDRNLIQSNFSGDDGGAIFVLDALDQPINIRNNMIVDNGAADMGAITLDDSSNVSIVNNTIANNVTTGSSENSQTGVAGRHSAGLASEANDAAWQIDPRHTDGLDFSNPVALFNNIFWNNDAMTLDQFSPGATLVDQGFIDFEVRGTTNNADTFRPRYSDLSNGQILGPNGVLHAVPGGQANIVGTDPLFVTPFILELTVSGSRLDPQQAAVTITGADPPVGLTGDYHLTTTSPLIDRGAGFSTLAAAAPLLQTPNGGTLAPCSGTPSQSYPADFDRQFRPQLQTGRVRTPWDLGADELSGTLLYIPGSYTQGNDATFNWNNPNPPCSGSTEVR